jgi:hypothetical protein
MSTIEIIWTGLRTLAATSRKHAGFAGRSWGFPQCAEPVDSGSYARHRPFHTFPAVISACGGLNRITSACVRRYPLNPQEQIRKLQICKANNGGTSMLNNLSEAAIDRIVAACNGDLRGAVKALLLVNEQLEAELAQLYAATGVVTDRGDQRLH